MEFGDKLREQRTKKGLTQEDLAKDIGVTRQTLRNYEKGISHPQDRNMYFILADYFGVDVNYFLTENEEFLTAVAEKFGKRGQNQAKDILIQTAALFAGGELSDPDKEAFVRDMQSLFVEASEIAQDKYTPKKYKKG
jgi:transcriptional regulator with XRE-family HTH domain